MCPDFDVLAWMTSLLTSVVFRARPGALNVCQVLGDLVDFDSRVIWMSELKKELSQRKITTLRYCR